MSLIMVRPHPLPAITAPSFLSLSLPSLCMRGDPLRRQIKNVPLIIYPEYGVTPRNRKIVGFPAEAFFHKV